MSCKPFLSFGSIKVADDLVLVARDKSSMQLALNITEDDSCREHYKFNPDKTKFNLGKFNLDKTKVVFYMLEPNLHLLKTYYS